MSNLVYSGWIIADAIMNAIIDGCKLLTHLLDKGVYTLVQVAYQVFAMLANASILTDRVVIEVTKRVYIIMAIIMVFVLAFNLLQYIIDPDKINDKKVGATAFVKDVIIALAIITFTPMLFTKLYSFQSKVLETNVIGNLILGGTDSTLTQAPEGLDGQSAMAYAMEKGANRMTASVYVAFLYPNLTKSGTEGSTDLWTAMDCPDMTQIAATCINNPNDPVCTSSGNMPSDVASYCVNYWKVQNTGNLDHFDDFITDGDFNFTPFLSTVAGVVLFFFILSFCVNLAKRVGKLAIIQLIAPIPAVLEIIPSKKGVRKNWFETLAKVYLEVFEYLLIMYSVVFLITLVPDAVAGIFSNIGFSLVSIVTTVFLIYGLLMFGKEAPKLLMDLLGLKESGSLKEVMQRAVHMGGATTAAIGAGTTTLARGAVSTTRNAYNANGAGAKAKAIAGGILGMGTGTIGAATRGMYLNRTGGFKGIVGKTSTAINQTAAAQRRSSARLNDYAEGLKNASGAKGFMGAAVKPVTSGVKDRILKPVGKWATGNNFGAMNAELQSYNQYKSVFDSTKIKPTSDERYLSFQKDLDKVFADNGIDINEFNARKKSYLAAHQGETLNDYLSSADFVNDFGSAGTHAASEISRLSGAMDSREAAMKVAKKDDLLVAIAQAKALVDGNSDIAAIARDSGIDIKSINVSASSSDAELVSAYDTLKKLNSKVGDKMTQIRTDIAAQEMRDQQKKSGGGSGNNK